MNHPDDLTRLSATELASMVRNGQTTSVAVVQAHLERIERLNPEINAFCTVLGDDALAHAAAADRAVGEGDRLGPLHGIPVALKDLTPVAGVRTTRGSQLFADEVSPEDALLVRRIRAAGGIILGKTNTPEFGHKGVTDNQLFGPTRNPWNPACTAGGSSGGSCAAVAAGMVPLAEGSDGAGSIRIPASLCGVFGFKPTYGRIPDVAGAFSSHTPFFHNGPIARSVTDAALLYQALAGAHDADPFSIPGDARVLDGLDDGIRGLRIAYSPNLGYFEVDPEVSACCERALEVLARLGAEVATVDLRLERQTERDFMVLWCGKLASNFGHLGPEQRALLEPKVQELIAAGERLSAVEYGRANLAREEVWRRLLQVHADHELLVCPTTAVPAFPLEQGAPTSINGRAVDPLLGWFLTYPFNLTGNPAASLPCGTTGDGLPIGLQVIGRHLADGTVLRACRSFERAAPWPLFAC